VTGGSQDSFSVKLSEVTGSVRCCSSASGVGLSRRAMDGEGLDGFSFGGAGRRADRRTGGDRR
jgi:hypothetical protein